MIVPAAKECEYLLVISPPPHKQGSNAAEENFSQTV
jgi:hypothetical protein